MVAAISATPTADPSGTVAGFADATSRFLPLVCTLNGANVLAATSRLLGVTWTGLAERAPRDQGSQPDSGQRGARLSVVVPRAGSTVTPGEVLDHARARLAGYKRPKYVVLADSLPKNPSGKILKRQLRDQYRGLADS